MNKEQLLDELDSAAVQDRYDDVKRIGKLLAEMLPERYAVPMSELETVHAMNNECVRYHAACCDYDGVYISAEAYNLSQIIAKRAKIDEALATAQKLEDEIKELEGA